MSFLEHNLEVIKEHHPELLDVVKEIEADRTSVRVTRAESGEPRVVFTKAGGEELHIHSAEDPVKCAREAVDLLNKTDKEGVIILLGFGLGYFAEELFKHFDKGHTMLIYEATPWLFKAALESRDLTNLLASSKIRILLGPEQDNFSFLHEYHHHIVNGRLYIVGHMPSMRLNQEAYERFRKRAKEENGLIMSGVGTAVGLGKEFVNAFMQNLATILRKPGVTALRDLFKHRPAIVVAAGPSLEKNLHLLQRAKSRAVIIAVDAAIPTLLPAGIIPDLLVAIDPLPENAAFFRDNPLLKEVPFICLTQYTPEIVSLYPGPVFMNTVMQNLVTTWLSPFWQDKGTVFCFGGSVAHMGFAAAEHLGCEPIALVGLDLSFGAKFHAGDASSLLTSVHGVPFEFKDRASMAENIFGESTYTLKSFLTFKTSFEKRLRTYTGTVVQASEGGLPLEGANTMRLCDFIDEHCNLPDLDARIELGRMFDTQVSYNLEALVKHVTSARNRFRETRKLSKRMLTHIHRLKKLRELKQEETDEFHQILDKVQEITEKVRHPLLNLLALYHYQLELYLKRQSVIEIDAVEDKYERLDQQLVRGLNYYGELIEAIDLFTKELDRLLADLRRDKKINKVLADTSLSEAERLLEAGRMFRKAGRISLAVKYFEATRAQLGSLPEIEFALAELYMKQFRFYEAKELLNELKDRGPGTGTGGKNEKLEPVKVQALIEECERKIAAWEEKGKGMHALVQKAEESYGDKLDSGLFYFRVKNFERALSSYSQAVDALSRDARADREACHAKAPLFRLVAAWYGLAHTFVKLGQKEKACDAFAKALEIDPENASIYKDLGLLAAENGNLDSAEMFLGKALELAPQNEDLYGIITRLLVSRGAREEAIALYEYGLAQNPGSQRLQKELLLLYKDAVLARASLGGNSQ
jgi:Tfp pilus assembly protein PilF